MTRQLPNIKSSSTPKQRLHRSSSVDLNPQKTRVNKLVEARLAKQFQYFRAEFLEHALSIGIPVPLDMVEDKNGKVMTFVNQKGPRYLLNIIHAYPESVHLLRSSLSFLIVIIAILSGKVKNSDTDNRLGQSNNYIKSWATEALNSIADSSSVAICTNLLRHSHSEAIQELILNLLAQLVSTSSEAAAQMMHRPQVNASGSGSSSRGSSDNSPRDNRDRDGASKSTADPDEMTCLSYMFSVVSHNRNRYTVMTACAEVCLALLKGSSSNSDEVCEAMARTWISRLPLVKPDDCKKKERYTGREQTSSLIKNKPREKNLRGKLLSVLTRKPPTTAQARGGGGNAKTASAPTSLRQASRAERARANPNEWAAFKVLLKFLHRFMRYGASDGVDSSPRQSGDQGRGLQDDTPFGDIDDESLGNQSARGGRQTRGNQRVAAAPAADRDDIVPHKHKKALYNAHSRVLLVVVELVANSSAVAKFILSMPGACAILKASCDMHKDSVFGEKVTSCLTKLQGETDTLYAKEMKHHHSVSFELTHGKSAKLFNPVSPIARRGSAMLIPDRSRSGEQEDKALAVSRPGSPFSMSGAQLMTGSGEPQKSLRKEKGTRVPPVGGREGVCSRPTSRGGTIPPSQLFCTEERRYLQKEHDKRMRLEESKALERDFFDEGDDEEEERAEGGDDSWFFNSFSFNEKDQKKKRNGKPPPIRTSFDGDFPSRPATASSQHFRPPPEPYDPPESPKRRGLGPHNGGIKAQKDPNASLHRSLFTNLPDLPDMPLRLEVEDIINDSNTHHKDSLLKRSESVTSSVVDTAYKNGFYRDGRNNIPISERARRVYVPEMMPFEGDADRHPNLITEEYLEERRNRPKSQCSVLRERSAKVRAMTHRRAASARAKTAGSQPSPSKNQNQEPYTDAFSDYYQGLLPLNGVGEVEAESEFQLFLVRKQQDGVGVESGRRATTAPSNLTRQGRRLDAGEVDDSMAFEDLTSLEDPSKEYECASYASSLSRNIIDHEDSQEDLEPPLVVDWSEEQNGARPPEYDRIVQSVDMLFP